eukprot:2194895-Lingulodinium_polyedra.AAC.1
MQKSVLALCSVFAERGSRCVRPVRAVFGCVRTCFNGPLELRMSHVVCCVRMNACSRVRQTL